MKICKRCGVEKELARFRMINGLIQHICRACHAVADVERARLRRQQRNGAARARLERQRAAAAAAIAPALRASNFVMPSAADQRIEQVLCRVATGDSLEYACWRVDVPIEAVKAWMEAS